MFLLFFTPIPDQLKFEAVKKHFSQTESNQITVKMQTAAPPTPPRPMVRPKILSKKALTPAPEKKVAKQPQESLAQNRSKAVSNAGQKSALAKYISEVQQVLEKKKFYPVLAKRMGHQGVVRASFSLDQNGKVAGLAKVEGGSRFLQDAVKELIKSRASFPPLPKEIGKSVLNLTIPIVFEL